MRWGRADGRLRPPSGFERHWPPPGSAVSRGLRARMSARLLLAGGGGGGCGGCGVNGLRGVRGGAGAAMGRGSRAGAEITEQTME